MRLGELVLISAGQGEAGRVDRDAAEDRPVLEDQPDVTVLAHHLGKVGADLATIRTLVVEIFDDRDVAIGVAGSGNGGVMQDARFAEDVGVGVFGAGLQRQHCGCQQQHDRKGRARACSGHVLWFSG